MKKQLKEECNLLIEQNFNSESKLLKLKKVLKRMLGYKDKLKLTDVFNNNTLNFGTKMSEALKN